MLCESSIHPFAERNSRAAPADAPPTHSEAVRIPASRAVRNRLAAGNILRDQASRQSLGAAAQDRGNLKFLASAPALQYHFGTFQHIL